jgi:hypothetical protein
MREGTMLRFVSPPPALYRARLDVVAPGEGAQFRDAQHATEFRQRAAHIERPLLPMPPQKFARRQAAEQTKLHARDYM